MPQNDETATQTQYCCPRCGQALGLPGDDGRTKVVTEGGQVWYLIGARLDCACGMRQTLGPDVRVGPAFVEKWYPDGAESCQKESGVAE